MANTETFLIVGASLAGAKAAEALRREGFDGRLILVGDERVQPYERPQLSKGYLRGEIARDTIDVHDAGFYESQGIELRLGRTAEHLDLANSTVLLDGGERVHYDRLLLTTGAAPRRLQVPGGDLEGVCYLRSVEDADALRARLTRGGRVVVVGAGWIGCEVAASARQGGLEVTVIAPDRLPLERALGLELGTIYHDLHRDHGVHLLLGTSVATLEGGTAVERVRTHAGHEVDCDLVVVGIGAEPQISLAAQSGIGVGNGIHVDEHLETSAPGVFAAGDVANAYHPFYGERIRVEHWANALNQGPLAAESMLGRFATYDRLPYFFSDQYDAGMEYTGFARDWDRVVFRGDPATREFVAFWVREGRVVAGMGMNVWDVMGPIDRLIRSRVIVDDRLANPDVPLERLAPTEQRSEG
jgi:3-phenylpropionate/trans-cinnamate dioxygenase ferredoxin reductase subunit